MNDLDRETYEATLTTQLVRACHRSKVSKDSDREYVILMDNERVSINGKNIWNSEKIAKTAIHKYIINAGLWYLKSHWVWKRNINISRHSIPFDLSIISNDFRKKWAEDHLRTIPLRDYMVFEHNKAKAKK